MTTGTTSPDPPAITPPPRMTLAFAVIMSGLGVVTLVLAATLGAAAVQVATGAVATFETLVVVIAGAVAGVSSRGGSSPTDADSGTGQVRQLWPRSRRRCIALATVLVLFPACAVYVAFVRRDITTVIDVRGD